jgi:3-oxoacyl-[acyl-carrier-protein] synthase II
MSVSRDVVITGLGVVSPIGIGKDAFWTSLAEQRSGVRRLDLFVACGRPTPIGGSVADFEPKKHVRARKSLKVMSRDIQLGFSASDQACMDAGAGVKPFDPERTGVVFGADMMAVELDELITSYKTCMPDGKFLFDLWGEGMKTLYPLWMLKYLPNMSACHVGIIQDLRGPNNTMVLGEVSSLAAITEAVRVIERGMADTMLAGGVGSKIQPMVWVHQQALEFSNHAGEPSGACRPFDRDRDGMVNGEGAAAFVLQSRASAAARGDKALARVLGFASAFEPQRAGQPLRGDSIRAALRQVLQRTGLKPADVGHVNAHGMSTILDDQIEAQAIADVLGDVPVTAPKSFFGDLGAGSGAVEMAASVLALQKGQVPPTLNYENPDPRCPVNVIRGASIKEDKGVCLVMNHSRLGQAVVVALAKE